MARYTRRRSTSGRSRSARSSYGSNGGYRRAAGRTRRVSRGRRASSRSNTVRVILNVQQPSAAPDPAVFGLKAPPPPKKAKF